MLSSFDQLLDDLRTNLRLLHPLQADHNKACALQVRKKLTVQIQEDGEKLLLISRIIEMQPGREREDVLRDALKANAMPDPAVGTFAFREKVNELILFQSYPMAILNGEKLSGLLGAFIKRAESWHDAIVQRMPPPIKMEAP